MNSSTNTFSFSNLNPLSFAAPVGDTLSFELSPTRSTADLLLRVAAKRQFVRAMQALRRR